MYALQNMQTCVMFMSESNGDLQNIENLVMCGQLISSMQCGLYSHHHYLHLLELK